MASQHVYTFTPGNYYYVPFTMPNKQKPLKEVLSEGLRKSFEKFCELYFLRVHQKASQLSKETQVIPKEVQVIEISSENEEIQHNKNQQQICAKTSFPKISHNPSTIDKQSLLDISCKSSAQFASSTPVFDSKKQKVQSEKEFVTENQIDKFSESEIEQAFEPKRRAFGQMQKKIAKKKISLLSRKVDDWMIASKKLRNQRRQIRMLTN